MWGAQAPVVSERIERTKGLFGTGTSPRAMPSRNILKTSVAHKTLIANSKSKAIT